VPVPGGEVDQMNWMRRRAIVLAVLLCTLGVQAGPISSGPPVLTPVRSASDPARHVVWGAISHGLKCGVSMLSPANDGNARVMLTIANAGPGKYAYADDSFPGMAADFVTTDRQGRAVSVTYSAEFIVIDKARRAGVLDPGWRLELIYDAPNTPAGSSYEVLFRGNVRTIYGTRIPLRCGPSAKWATR
jgi:hypothetical protein